MPLPIATLPIVERWDCHQCGICCRGSIVPLSEADVARLQAQGWPQRPEYRGVKTIVPLTDGRSGMQLGKRRDGSCVFLMDDGLCQIHKELGFDAKPLICRMFPLQLIPQDKQAILTLRRACPSAAGDKGTPLGEQLSQAKAYASEGLLVEQGASAPPFKPGEPAEWKRSRIVLEALRRVSTDSRFPPIRRYVHGLEMCRLLEQAQTQDFNNGKLAELVSVIEANVPAEAAEYFAERRLPERAARILLRQTALEVVRLHPRIEYRPSWRSRTQLLYWALQMLWGRGALPRVSQQFPQVRFEQLEEPLGRLEAAAFEPLTKYLETTASSYQYALAQRHGWSVIESYRQLALLYPLGLWLLRWLTHGRTPTKDDVCELISALDRSQGYAALTGARQRSRLRALAKLNALPALVAWYGR